MYVYYRYVTHILHIKGDHYNAFVECESVSFQNIRGVLVVEDVHYDTLLAG